MKKLLLTSALILTFLGCAFIILHGKDRDVVARDISTKADAIAAKPNTIIRTYRFALDFEPLVCGRVNALLTVRGPTARESFCQVVVENLEVLDASDSIAARLWPSRFRRTVTLKLTPYQAEQLDQAQVRGSLSFVVRRFDSRRGEVSATTVEEILTGFAARHAGTLAQDPSDALNFRLKKSQLVGK